MAQKKVKSKDGFDTSVDDNNKLNAQKKHKAKEARHHKKELKSAMLDDQDD